MQLLNQANIICSDSKQLLPVQNTLENIYKLKEIIKSEINTIHYTSSKFTLTQKLCMCQAFSDIIDQYPEQMVDYFFNKKKQGLQHKIFQQFVLLLEQSIPFSYIKNKTQYTVNSLLDPNLSIFDGISNFSSKINNNKIKNETKELYIGGRNGFYSRPYYIGKLLDITHNSNSILNKVIEYGFSEIKIKEENLSVKITHLRIVPHYQLGGMLYLNRLKTKIQKQL